MAGSIVSSSSKSDLVVASRRGNGLFKVAKWVMGIAAVGGAISGTVMSFDGSETIGPTQTEIPVEVDPADIPVEPTQTEIPVKVDSAEVPVEPTQTEATVDDIQNVDLTIKLGKSTYQPFFGKPKCNDPNRVDMPVLKERLGRMIKHIAQYTPKKEKHLKYKDLAEKLAKQTTITIPVNLANDLCSMKSGKLPKSFIYEISVTFTMRLIPDVPTKIEANSFCFRLYDVSDFFISALKDFVL
ncbi:hypothetical protein protein, putative [Babesia ovis]|uniref:DUF1411 domain-containing protein n=1 Tax=Babesia ovis TaxID=5869 RepID=A0A9W5TBA6_BABOV|nr:hypothetical protein protein, putative [Babesia ovis]